MSVYITACTDRHVRDNNTVSAPPCSLGALCNSVVMSVSCSVLHSEYLDGLVVLISRYIRHKILSVITSLFQRPKTLIIRDE